METAQFFEPAAAVAKLLFQTNKTLPFLKRNERFDPVAIKGYAVEWTERRLHQAAVSPKIGAYILTEPGYEQLPAGHQIGKQIEYPEVVLTRSAAFPTAGGTLFSRVDHFDNGMHLLFAGSNGYDSLSHKRPSGRGDPVEFLRHCGYCQIPHILVRHIVSCMRMK
jgi:hypothetical protein